MTKLDNRQKGLKQLFFPIFIEVLFFMLVGSIDTLMLSTVGDIKVEQQEVHGGGVVDKKEKEVKNEEAVEGAIRKGG